MGASGRRLLDDSIAFLAVLKCRHVGGHLVDRGLGDELGLAADSLDALTLGDVCRKLDVDAWQQALETLGITKVSAAVLYVAESRLPELYWLPAWWEKRGTRILDALGGTPRAAA